VHVQPTRTLVTEAEFLALPESVQKIELVDGEVVVSPAPSYRHQEVLSRLVTALRAWGEGREVTVVQSPFDVRFGESRILQPDAMVLLERLPLDVKSPLDRVPELCIEVLSTDRVYDRVTKRSVYASAGVHEYWVVDAAGYLERWTGPALAQRQEVTSTLTTPLLPGFSIEVAELLGD
jgi:Uma2 family endonuclease